ncbi:uncharacterized protein LOC110839871 [Zootermopsis nevadensis]|uniref:Synaptosomal-associated protein 29 n=1 Tax=Zootermopsis nevadensis TaxID=136037 RepID=A0A067QHS2_ZOONE|nr:uncharacterized protein LOC110839871 [Zootermopsis nevadensis]KDR07945.1 hypothetical protein L798_01599 [Zootermopsis nevadensis]
MSDGNYEYELMRSELLGLPPPEKKPLPPASQNEEDMLSSDVDDDSVERNEDIHLEGEQMGRVSGGLDELNSILSMTQKKINRFKSVCGSFTNLLKLRVSSKQDGTTSDSSSRTSEADCALPTGEVHENSDSGTDSTESKATLAAKKTTQQNLDLEGNLGSQIDKLDTMLMKAEQAELSMSKQNKEMRIFLKK